jgi:kanamycin kinase/aminoglycoside 3'-phosphotransferase-2
VPKVLFYEILDDKEFLCLTKLVGETLDKLSDKSSGGKIVQHYARALKLLHSLPIDELALKLSLEARLENAQYNLLNQVIDYEQLDPVNRNVPPNLLYQKLVELVPKNLDLVFTHGDYCLDNLIYDAHQLSGFIDLGNGGVADRYQDIALAIRSIRHDLGDQFVSVFLKEYGLEDLDQQKVEFFQLLDEFF